MSKRFVEINENDGNCQIPKRERAIWQYRFIWRHVFLRRSILLCSFSSQTVAKPIQRKKKWLKKLEKLRISFKILSFHGAAGQIRTADLILTKDALYLLSYSSISPP